MALLQKAYLGATPLFKNVDWFEDGAYQIIDTSSLVTITANTSAHTKGSWTELIASSSGNASFIQVIVQGVSTSGTNTATLIDLATGASGSETAFASDIAIGGAAPSATGGTTRITAGIVFGFPIKIASGTRVSARIQSVVTGGKTAACEITLIDAGDYATAPTSVDVIGTSTANSQGTSFSGASGTWVEATSSTSQAYRAIAYVGSVHNANIVSFAAISSIGIGASGSEVVIGDTRYVVGTLETISTLYPFNLVFGRAIPSGSRLAVKHNIAANPGNYGFTLIGIP
jgi:hypothetical protein